MCCLLEPGQAVSPRNLPQRSEVCDTTAESKCPVELGRTYVCMCVCVYQQRANREILRIPRRGTCRRIHRAMGMTHAQRLWARGSYGTIMDPSASAQIEFAPSSRLTGRTGWRRALLDVGRMEGGWAASYLLVRASERSSRAAVPPFCRGKRMGPE